ncbi:gamma-glutamylcyclotransferase [Litchfieldella qijiaojingensis]|uniref:Gamma-glutamylcyclotransferase family protein n=1 Tax=Litchfieldella qijiaojingensis TaxID=980347 RepID=A0ABQ2YLF8_9GAMM|nr:gamma-glutamylcyclotransferase family protein [Halomonas qijiaojingensis]GGX88304.1 gamma-glutamylcyclotransferase [Halomonas qijiaojingensis]
MTHLLFVYGTLKRGFTNHGPYMTTATFLDTAKTCDTFPLVLHGADYTPVLIDAQGRGHRVKGELYRVDNPTLDKLDRLEGVNERDGYRRRRLAVTDSQGGMRSVWGYFKSPAEVEDVRSKPLAVYDERHDRPPYGNIGTLEGRPRNPREVLNKFSASPSSITDWR